MTLFRNRRDVINLQPRGETGAALSSFPVATELPSSDDGRIYVGRARTQLGYGAASIALSLLGLLPAHQFLNWYHGGPMPQPNAFWILICLLLFPLGLIGISNALRGLPRLTIGAQGVSLQGAFKTQWANWDSVGPFAVVTRTAGRSRRQVKRATATISGPNASIQRSTPMLIPDHFDRPIDDIVTEINTARALSLGVSHLQDSPIAEPTPVGLQGFFVPWVTLALFAVLNGIYGLESFFPVTPAVKGAPSLLTLVAMGGLSHTAILSLGEWYRLFTAPLLHADVGHLAGNGVALLLGGWMLERLVGRLWFFVFFAVGALGGSLASLTFEPANLISVGASGALMGMFAGVFVCSFRMSSTSRVGFQVSSLRILVPSLLPFLSKSGGMHIDYGAHGGGALAGAALALVLLQDWPKTASIPQGRRVAVVVAAVSLVLFAGSAALVAGNYPQFKAAVAARTNLPAKPPTAPPQPVAPQTAPPQAAAPQAATPQAATDGRASYLRSDPIDPNAGGKRSFAPLSSCKSLFPSGQGAAPGINCSN